MAVTLLIPCRDEPAEIALRDDSFSCLKYNFADTGRCSSLQIDGDQIMLALVGDGS